MLWNCKSILFNLACAGYLASFAFTAHAADKQPVPDAISQRRSQTLIHDLYKAEYAQAKTPTKKGELAGEFLRQAADTKNDPVGRFVLLSEARDLAAGAVDLTQAAEIIDVMGSYYEIEDWLMKVDAAIAVSRALTSTTQASAFIDSVLEMMDRASSADNFDAAKRLGAVALAAARKTHDAELVKQLNGRLKQTVELEKSYDEAAAAIADLKQKPASAKSNLVVGRYYALTKGDWPRGLPFLARTGDEKLADVARQELTLPKLGDEQVRLADRWWSYADAESGSTQQQFQFHAGYWYNLAVPNLPNGLTKLKVEKRLSLLADTRIVADCKLVLWNAHSAEYRDRGTLACRVKLLLKNAVVWESREIAVKWDGNVDPKTVVPLPKVSFDTLHIDFLKWHQFGSGLSEVELYRGQLNVARGRPVHASSTWPNVEDQAAMEKSPVAPSKLTDGITQSNEFGKGFWLSGPGVAWIEISFPKFSDQ